MLVGLRFQEVGILVLESRILSLALAFLWEPVDIQADKRRLVICSGYFRNPKP